MRSRYAVRNMHGAVLAARQLQPGTDLKRAFVAAMLQWIDAGWQRLVLLRHKLRASFGDTPVPSVIQPITN